MTEATHAVERWAANELEAAALFHGKRVEALSRGFLALALSREEREDSALTAADLVVSTIAFVEGPADRVDIGIFAVEALTSGFVSPGDLGFTGNERFRKQNIKGNVTMILQQAEDSGEIVENRGFWSVA